MVDVVKAAAGAATDVQQDSLKSFHGSCEVAIVQIVNNSQGQPPKHVLGRLKMDITVAESSGQNATPEKNPKQHFSPVRSADKYANARNAKKKKRRAAHRAMIRRSHANG